MKRRVLWSVPIVCTLAAASWPVHAEQTDSLRALVVTGQNNHGWQVLSDHYETILKEPAYFDLDVSTSPPPGADMSGFAPDFDARRGGAGVQRRRLARARSTVVRALHGERRRVVYAHAVNHTFTDWEEFNLMIGVGGSAATTRHGPYVRTRTARCSSTTARDTPRVRRRARIRRRQPRAEPPDHARSAAGLARAVQQPAGTGPEHDDPGDGVLRPGSRGALGRPDPRHRRPRADVHDSLRRGPGVRHRDGPRRRRCAPVGSGPWPPSIASA